jgi:hypothetical protein
MPTYDLGGELTGWDLEGFHSGGDTELWKRLGAHETSVFDHDSGERIHGTRFAVWAPNAQNVQVIGDFNFWSGDDMILIPGSGVWSRFIEARRHRHPVQVPHPGTGRRLAREGRPHGPVLGDGPGQRQHRLPVAVHLVRRRLDGQARGVAGPRSPDQRLRAAPRRLAARQDLPRAGRRARRVRDMAGLHPRRVHAGGRAPVRAELGLPGHRLLLPDLALRASRRAALPRRPSPPGGHRRDHGLGARVTSPRTSGRWAASTAPRCTSTRTPARASTRTGARTSSTTAATR